MGSAQSDFRRPPKETVELGYDVHGKYWGIGPDGNSYNAFVPPEEAIEDVESEDEETKESVMTEIAMISSLPVDTTAAKEIAGTTTVDVVDFLGVAPDGNLEEEDEWGWVQATEWGNVSELEECNVPADFSKKLKEANGPDITINLGNLVIPTKLCSGRATTNDRKRVAETDNSWMSQRKRSTGALNTTNQESPVRLVSPPSNKVPTLTSVSTIASPILAR